MPLFVPQEQLEEADRLRDENERLTQELRNYREMDPLIKLAEEVRSEIVAFMDSRPDLNAPEIAEQAYRNVLDRNMHTARDEVAARYEQEHRRSLYERVLGEVATNEGDSISEKVRQKVETDPDLAKELHQSARKELAARATDVVRSEITAEQQVIINQEAERQIALDRLDVKLALDRELDLTSPEVISALKPGDKVELFFATDAKKRERIVLTWMRDAKGNEGWVYSSASTRLYNEQSHGVLDIDENRFVSFGVVNKDLVNGKLVPQINRLVVGMPLVFEQKNNSGTSKMQRPSYRSGGSLNSYSSYATYEPVELIGTDFQTKDIVFTNNYDR